MSDNSSCASPISNISFNNECIICFNTVNDFFVSFDTHYETAQKNDSESVVDINNIQTAHILLNNAEMQREVIERNRSLFYYNLKNQNCNCSYNVHFECLVYWLLNNPQCPVCRNVVNINTPSTPITIKTLYNKIIIVSDGINEVIIDLNHCKYLDFIHTNNQPRNQPRNELLNEQRIERHRTNKTVQLCLGLITFTIILIVVIIYITSNNTNT